MAPKVIGIAWYRPQDWNRLREIAADPDELEESHGAWLTTVQRVMRRMERDRLRVRKVIIDLDELQAFCRKEGLANTCASRSRFVAEKVRREECGES